MLEQEVKMLLSSCEYNLLVCRFSDTVSIRQVNYYFDTYDYKWHRNRVTCRIREKAGNFEATIKSHVNKSVGVSIERSQQVQDECDTSFFEDVNICYQGKLVTERLCIMLADDIEVAIDRNVYLGMVDYEIEIEHLTDCASISQEHVAMLLTEYLVQLTELPRSEVEKRVSSCLSKSERFFLRKIMLQSSGS